MIKRVVVPITALMIVGACSRGANEAPGAAEEAVRAQAALERIMAMEICGDVPSDEAPFDCRLEAEGEGKPGRQLIVSFPPREGDASSRVVRIEIADLSGESLQVIEEEDVSGFGYPNLQDIDGDAALDLFVPLYTGNVNTTYAVYLQRGSGNYVRAGELSGLDFSYRGDGIVTASGRSSAASWGVEYFRVASDAFVPAAAVYVEATGVDENNTVTGSKCTIESVTDPALATADLCKDEAVSSIYALPEPTIE